jgi:hypothetical protein
MALKSDLEDISEAIRFLPRGADTLLEGDLTTAHSQSHGRPLLVEEISGTAYAPSEVAGVAASGPELESRLRDAGFNVLSRAELHKLCDQAHSA